MLAANLELLVAVASDPPKPDWFVIDRYLSAAEFMGIRAAVVFNKADIANAEDHRSVLGEYRDAGYPVVVCSAVSGDGLQSLLDLMKDQTAILVGQSGVGKSSIINRISSDEPLRTGAVSTRSGEGRHTTVNSVLRELSTGGGVIDSPGVRDYAPALEINERIDCGFREIADASAGCRYSDCKHLREPGCAVKDAVEAGDIPNRRYASYKRLVNLTNSLAAPY